MNKNRCDTNKILRKNKTYRILDHAVEQNQYFDNKVSLERKPC